MKNDNSVGQWKPPLEENVLECLGPENCPGLTCETTWDDCLPECKGKDCKNGCQKWWPKLDPKKKEEVRQFCEATQEPRDERTELDAPVERQNQFNLYDIKRNDGVITKYRYAVDVERRRMFYHDAPGKYESIEDSALLKTVERLVAEKCRYGGAYYKLSHYGIDIASKDGSSCDHLREDPDGFLAFIFGDDVKGVTRRLRQQGLDGWFWKMFGKPPYGVFTSPLLLPWEVDRCATKPCPGQCIAIHADAAATDCPASSAFWPVRMIGGVVTSAVVPLLALRLVLYLSGSMVSRLRCCPRACKDGMRHVHAMRRLCWFEVMRGTRKFRKAGSCVQTSLVIVGGMCLYFFSQ